MLEVLGDTVVLQGGPGSGQHTKMVNQILIAGTCGAFLTGDLFNLYLGNAIGDTCEASRLRAYTDEDGLMGWYGGPLWGTFTDNWDAFAGGDWLKVGWRYWDEYGGGAERYGGFFLGEFQAALRILDLGLGQGHGTGLDRPGNQAAHPQ